MGHVLEVRVIEGQLVHAGDVLVAVDPKDYKVAVEQAGQLGPIPQRVPQVRG